MRKHGFIVVAAALSLFLGVLPAGAGLQEMADAAGPSGALELPAGRFQGPVVLPEGLILSGAGAGLTVIEGGSAQAVIEGSAGCMIKDLTVEGGSVGIRNGGYLILVAGCEFADNKISAVYAGGGGCVLVNNLVRGEGKLGFQVSAAPGIVANNTIASRAIGLQVWKTPLGLFANNILFDNSAAVRLETSPYPQLTNNDFWGNRSLLESGDAVPDSLYLDPVFADPETGDYTLQAESVLLAAGVPVEGVPEDLARRVGCDLSRSLSVDECHALLQALEGFLASWGGTVVYTLGAEPGVFGVTVSQGFPEFRVVSSASGTRIDEVEAYDRVADADLPSEILEGDPESVRVFAPEGAECPPEPDRYVMDSAFSLPESLRLDSEGKLVFTRKSNLRRIRVAIPEGWEVESCSPAPAPDSGGLLIENPRGELVEVSIRLAPLTD